MTQQNRPDDSPRQSQRRQPARLRLRLSYLIALGLLCSLGACAPTAERADSIPPSDASDRPTPKPEATVAPQAAPNVSAEPSDDSLNRSGDANLPRARSNQRLIGPASEREAALTDCGSLETQSAMNLCAQQNYAQVDADLNEAYRALKAVLPDGGEEALTTAEIAWLQFRDLDCDFERNAFASGSMAPLTYNTCLSERTSARTDELFYPDLPDISYQAADAQLNETYQALTAVLSKDRQNDLSEVQIAWVEYRDRNCDFEILYGSNVIEKSQCLARMSAARTAQLQADLAQSRL
ncbi:MAG: lysozyme inhibitor LprI family protein [Phormidesmis sp.]